MIAFNFKLTPYQVKLLLQMAYGHYTDTEPRLPLAAAESSFFIVSARSLERKNLIDHDISRSPTFQVTEEGRSVADLIVKSAAEICNLAETAKTLPDSKS